jgi:hypothetical protein
VAQVTLNDRFSSGEKRVNIDGLEEMRISGKKRKDTTENISTK